MKIKKCAFVILAYLMISLSQNNRIFAQDNKPKPKVQLQDWRTNFDEAWTFTEGFAVVRKNKSWDYIDVNGSIKIPLIYDKTYGFIKGAAWVVKNGRNSYINKKGICIKNCK